MSPCLSTGGELVTSSWRKQAFIAIATDPFTLAFGDSPLVVVGREARRADRHDGGARRCGIPRLRRGLARLRSVVARVRVAATWLRVLLDLLKIEKPVVVSPSMSGRYSLPLLTEIPEKVAGFVAVAPVAIKEYKDRSGSSTMPVLAIWGENDTLIPQTQADLLIRSVKTGRKGRHPKRQPCPVRVRPGGLPHRTVGVSLGVVSMILESPSARNRRVSDRTQANVIVCPE